MRFGRVSHNPPPAIRLQRILKLPERVTGQIGADEELTAPRETKGAPSVPELLCVAGCLRGHEKISLHFIMWVDELWNYGR